MIALLFALISGGAPDATHTAVVQVQPICSGVVVAPRVVLTAGHCAHVASSVAVAGRTVLIAEKHLYPDYTGATSDELAGLDLAALVLSEDTGVAPLPYARTPPALGPATAIGFGSGQREAADVTMQSPCERLVGFGDAVHFAEDGDSGGALVAGGELVGILSFRTLSMPPDWAVRTDPYARWIDAVVAGAPDDACTQTCPPAASDCFRAPAEDAGCSCSVASHGTGGALAVMLLLMLARRR